MKNLVRHRSIMINSGLIISVGTCSDNDDTKQVGFMDIVSRSHVLTRTELFPQTTLVQDVIEFGKNKIAIILLMINNDNSHYSSFMCFDISVEENKGICITDITEDDGLPIVSSHCRFVRKSSTNYISPVTKLILMGFDSFQRICKVDTFDSYDDTKSAYVLDVRLVLANIRPIDSCFRVSTDCIEALVTFNDVANNKCIRDIIMVNKDLRSITEPVINYNHLIFIYTAFNKELQVNEYFTFVQPYTFVNNCLIKSDAGYSI